MKNLLCMALSLCLLSQANAQSLSPTLGASVKFGGISAPQWQWRAAATQRVYSGRTAIPLPLVAVDFDATRAPRASVLGMPLAAAAPVLGVDGAQRQSDSSWVWIGLGLGAVVAVAIVASDGSSKSNNNESSGNTSCNGVSGDLSGPNPPTVGSGCGSLVSGNGGS
ncbi:MAG: hypothetical protein V4650_12735 [Pseudomonadota bacterium]